jgi:co-chaperonin GroES (HSP10)
MKTVLNNNIIVQLKNSVELKNGINLKETRGKRDVVTAIVYLADPKLNIKKGDTVWFPLYASNEITIDGLPLAVLNSADIIMVEDHAELHNR